MKSRRHFIRDISILGLGAKSLTSLSQKSLSTNSTWTEIANQYFKDPNGNLNFNTGSAGVMPISVYNEYIKNVKALCEYAPYEIKASMKTRIRRSLKRLANLVNVQPEEISYVRNTTAGINHILLGFPFKEGDEIVISEMAYSYVKNIAKRLIELKKVVIRTVRIPGGGFNSDEIFAGFKNEMSSRTALIVVTGITHQFGYRMPVKSICQLSHQYGAKTLVDAAHCIGHIPQDIKDLECDYYVSSLHKWMSAPLGTGMLYIKNGLTSDIEPLLPCPHPDSESMVKFDYTGTVAFQNVLSMEAVLDFQEAIGYERKFQRLHSLADLFVSQIKDIPTANVFSDKDNLTGVIAFNFKGKLSTELLKKLEESYGIHAKLSGYRRDAFIRASINLHLEEMDVMYFANSVRELVAS